MGSGHWAKGNQLIICIVPGVCWSVGYRVWLTCIIFL
jgi:hypothetical protein